MILKWQISLLIFYEDNILCDPLGRSIFLSFSKYQKLYTWVMLGDLAGV